MFEMFMKVKSFIDQMLYQLTKAHIRSAAMEFQYLKLIPGVHRNVDQNNQKFLR